MQPTSAGNAICGLADDDLGGQHSAERLTFFCQLNAIAAPAPDRTFAALD